MPNFPASLDAAIHPGPGTFQDDPGFELDVLVSQLYDIVVALETKLGISASTPGATPGVLRRSATGASAWGQIQAGDVVGGAITTAELADGTVQAVDLADGTSALKKIAEVSGTGGSPVLTFASIPQTYRALVLDVVGRSDAAVSFSPIRLTLNGNTTAGSYFSETAQASGGSVATSEQLGTVGYFLIGFAAGASSVASFYGGVTAEMPEYANNTIYHPVGWRSSGAQSGAAGLIIVTWGSGLFALGPGITSLSLTLANGNWTSLSRATLWGKPS